MPHITTCSTCGACYEEFSEEIANMQTRECSRCWLRRENAEHEEREFAEAERQIWADSILDIRSPGTPHQAG